MSENVVDIEVIQPGRPIGQYHALEYDLLHLDKVLYPEVQLPFDLGILPKTLTENNEPLQVVLLGGISHPPHTQVGVRLLGGIQVGETAPFLLAVPVSDDRCAEIMVLDDLSERQRFDIRQHLQPSSTIGNGIRWLERGAIQNCMKEAYLNYRRAKTEAGRGMVSRLAWKAVVPENHVTSYSEAEHYTAAEYTFFQLPQHMQFYVSAYLERDERILYSVRRPAMRSCRKRSWRGGEKLREGVLILTTQRLIQLSELTPLGESGVRYGFQASLGALERLIDVKVETLNTDAILLKTFWRARDGKSDLEWESPFYTRSSVLELVDFLGKFSPAQCNPFALLRATGSDPPDPLPALSDPAANDPRELTPVNERFKTAVMNVLSSGEKVYAWALWPAWYENRGFAQVLVVTQRRVMVIPDPIYEERISLELALTDIATLEYVGSILSSQIGLNACWDGKIHTIPLSFPYSAEGAFHHCFEAMRRCSAILSL